MKTIDPNTVREHVRTRYGGIAEENASCCGPTQPSCCGENNRFYGEKLGYSAEELAAAPAGANLGLGCGNPLAIASIKPGEVVLDLGSGGGFDCFLAARQLNGTGKVIGVDMTAEMITKARANARKGGYTNIEFRLGEIEALPVADASVDLIISNCVVNLSPEKPRVFREAVRVLKPGGRLALADVVATQPLPEKLRNRLDAVSCCIGGAALVDDLKAMLFGAGFDRVEIVPNEPSRRLINEWIDDASAGDYVVSAMITAFKSGK